MAKNLLVILLVASAMLMASAAVWEGKTYTHISSVNYHEYLKELGVDDHVRMLAEAATPTISLKQDGDDYTLETVSQGRSTVINFQLDKEFEEETLDGRQVKSVITLVGDNTFIHKQGGEPASENILEFDEQKMVATMTAGDVLCTRTYIADS